MLTLAEIGGGRPPSGTGGAAREQPAGDRLDRLDRVDALDQDDELVAAEPGDGAVGAGDLEQPLGHLDEQGVADLVAEGVVDGLEPVDVQQEHGQAAGRALETGERVSQPVAEQGAVGQAGQGVGQRQPLELGLLAQPVAHVDGVGDEVQRLALSLRGRPSW